MATKKSTKATKKAEPAVTSTQAAQAPAQAPAGNPPPGGQQQVAGLSLTDLVTVTQIIQLSSQRGAFRPEEMEQVGALYTKLVAFLQQTGALATPGEEEKKDA